MQYGYCDDQAKEYVIPRLERFKAGTGKISRR